MNECNDPDEREKYSKLILPKVCPYCGAILEFANPKAKPKIEDFLVGMIIMGALILPLFVVLQVIAYNYGIDLISMLGIPALVGIILIVDIISAVILVHS